MSRAEEMRAVLARWKDSGESLFAFADREQVSYAKLQYWALKLGLKKRKKRERVEFVPIKLDQVEQPVRVRPPHVGEG